MDIIPFNGDRYIGEEIQKLVKKFGIQTIIETGTWAGHTTVELAKYSPHTITVDPTQEHFEEDTLRLFEQNNIGVLQADSSIVLADLLSNRIAVSRKDHNLVVAHPVLLYLDSHGGSQSGETSWNVNPLTEELEAIAKSVTKGDCVIVIHDFKVPGKEWGYNGGNWGKGWEPLSIELVSPFLEKIYPKGYHYYYNEKVEGACRGVLFVHQK